MFGQTFAFFDLGRLAILGFLEILLSADNAVILGLISRALPERQRRRALFVGLLSTLLLRALALILVFHLLRFAWIQLLGAFYLLYLSISYFLKSAHSPTAFLQKKRTFWTTVCLIEFFDLAFALDSILAGIAFIGPLPAEASIHPKLWIVYLGVAIGLVGVRFAASAFSKLIERFPNLEMSAHLMIGWIGVKLAWTTIAQMTKLHYLSDAGIEILFWGGLALLFAFGLLKRHD